MELQVFKNEAALISSRDTQSLIGAFLGGLDVKESSRRLYGRTLKQFFSWVDLEGLRLPELTKADIAEYKSYLENTLKLSPLTIGSYIVSLRKFYEWIEAEGLYKNITKGIKTPQRSQAFEKQYLSERKSRELLEYFKGNSLRDYAIVNLMLRTGLRTIEVSRAQIGDICYMGEQRVLKIWGKGKSEADKGRDYNFVVLTDKTYLPIKNYLEATRRGAKSGEPLFTSNSHQNQGEQLSTRTISGLCKEGLKAIGLDGKEYTAHSLRHTTASLLLGHGETLLAVQHVLRHASVNTTQRYTKLKEREMRLTNAPETALDFVF
jgi:integrase/recombinase XerC/integrase/recombinase XerD